MSEGMDYSLYEIGVRRAVPPHRWRVYAGYFSGCAHVLDVGCGQGAFLEALRAQGISAVGVERNHSLCQKTSSSGLDVVEADAVEHLSRNVAAYDGIFCHHVIEHMRFEELCRLTHVAHGALRPGGRLVVVTPNPESITAQLSTFWQDPEHVRFYHHRLLCSLLCQGGFEINECAVHWYDYPTSRRVNSRPTRNCLAYVAGAVRLCSWPVRKALGVQRLERKIAVIESSIGSEMSPEILIVAAKKPEKQGCA